LLVLSRRVGESIMIGPDVVVTVLEVRPDLVRIGINAPRDVEVHREEVFVEVQQANRSAASPDARDVQALAAGLRDEPAASQAKPSQQGKQTRSSDAAKPGDPSRSRRSG
jgi:carbon storage regulator